MIKELFERKSETGQIATNTLAQGVGKGVSLVLALVTTVILTRYLGAEGYGRYVFVTAMVLVFSSIADWGTGIITVREAVVGRKKRGEIFGALTLTRLGFSLIAFLLVNVAVRVNPEWEELVRPTTMGSLVLLLLSLKTSAGMVFQARLRLEWQAVVEMVGAGVFLGAVWLVWLLRGGLEGVIGGWVVTTGVAAAVGWGLVRRTEKVEWKLSREVIERVVREAVPTGALLLVFSVYNRVDVLILQHFQGDGAVGIYGLAYKIHDNLVLGAAFLMNAAFPGLVKKFAKGEMVALGRRYRRLFKVLLLGGVGVAGVMVVAAPLVVQVLSGEGFGEASLPLRILMGATVFSYLNHLTGYTLIAVGKQRVSLAIAVGALGFNVGLNLWLVPLYSYVAAAIVTVVTEGVVLGLSSMAIYRALREGKESFE